METLVSGRNFLVGMLISLLCEVVMNDTANTVLQMGGLPVMAHSVDEVADITAVSQALVLNIGTLSNQWIEGMNVAGKKVGMRLLK